MSLHTKYRPEDFSEFYGNKRLVKKLKPMLDNLETYPPTTLITGPYGCGKTTLGRIIAAYLGCIGSDFVYLNGANDRGIASMRDLVEVMGLMPMNGLSRVALIDEAHRLTKDAEESILTFLEEPPKTSYFVLCTAEPQGLGKAFKQRCSPFEVDYLKDDEIRKLITAVIKEEEGNVPDKIIKEIADCAEGTPRVALIILGQVINLPPKSMLSAIDPFVDGEFDANTIDLCRGLNSKASWEVVSDIVLKVKDDPERIRRGVIGYFRKVILNTKVVSNKTDYAAFIIDCFRDNLYSSGLPGLSLQCYNALTLWKGK
uniref:Putative DNA polymerase n=1 Tax=viral metagenome TaxID=1070528 RepID=A0A6M3IMT9_9ZZZZ